MKVFVDAAFCQGREEKVQRQPHIVRGYFGGPHILYTLDANPLIF
ncbi:hypothetical protein [Streptomyces prunicolor]